LSELPHDHLSVDDISEPELPSVEEAQEEFGAEFAEDERKTKEDYENELLAETIQDRQQDREQRKEYADKLFILIKYWLIALLAVLLINGWGILWFELSDAVLLALVGGTTANVLGLFLIVLYYLFPKH